MSLPNLNTILGVFGTGPLPENFLVADWEGAAVAFGVGTVIGFFQTVFGEGPIGLGVRVAEAAIAPQGIAGLVREGVGGGHQVAVPNGNNRRDPPRRGRRIGMVVLALVAFGITFAVLYMGQSAPVLGQWCMWGRDFGVLLGFLVHTAWNGLWGQGHGAIVGDGGDQA